MATWLLSASATDPDLWRCICLSVVSTPCTQPGLSQARMIALHYESMSFFDTRFASTLVVLANLIMRCAASLAWVWSMLILSLWRQLPGNLLVSEQQPLHWSKYELLTQMLLIALNLSLASTLQYAVLRSARHWRAAGDSCHEALRLLTCLKIILEAEKASRSAFPYFGWDSRLCGAILPQ